MVFQYPARGIFGDLTRLMRCSSSLRLLSSRCRRKSPAGAAERPAEG